MSRNIIDQAILLLLLLMTSMDLSGQSISSIDEYIQDNEALPGEKVFIHTDRSDYMQGDTIWFKAYSWFGYGQVPDTLSGVLYVDLLNSDGKVRLNRKLLIQNGTSQGDFCLDTTISPGAYTLRAYTMWMGNINTGEPYSRIVNVNPSSQNFQIECTPAIRRWPGNDSLMVSLRFFEIDQSGELNYSYNHKVNYSLRIGSQVLDSGQFMAANNKEQILNSSLPDQGESDAVLTLSVKDPTVNFDRQFHIPVKDGIDLQFFPEGGRLVNGLQSRVAFKAIGTDGLSREVQGTIEDKDGEINTIFKSLHKGMGAFLLKPIEGKEYFASLWYNNRKYVIPMPQASDGGSVMTLSSGGNEEDRVLTIKQSTSEVNAQKYIVGSAYGKIWFSASVNMTKDSCSFKIPQELLPEGVCRITVLDNYFKPECERLIYVDKKQRFKIEVTPDSSSYGTRSKVTLVIKTNGADGLPVQTEMSLSVVDMEQEAKGKEEKGIVAYKLLESELKGYIEDAGYYFKGDSCTDREALDLLMLTQGYRKFLPDTVKGELKFQPERDFVISGNLKLNGSKSRERRYNYSDIDLSLISISEPPYIGQFNPDSAGRFQITLPLLYGKARSILQATTSKNKPFYGEITLDEPLVKPEFKAPLLTSNIVTSPVIEYVNRLQATKKTEIRINPEYGMMSVRLPEVTVTAKAKNWYRDFEPNAEKIADLDFLDPSGDKYESIFDLLISEFGAEEYIISSEHTRTIVLPCIAVGGNGRHFPIYLINNRIYSDASEREFIPLMQGLYAIRVNEIKKLMVLPPGDISAHYASYKVLHGMGIRQSLVVIETYSNNSYRGDPTGIKTFIMDGLDTPRQFYSPLYDGPYKQNPVYDSRVTLFWEPSVMTDATGQAKIEFYTSDRKTELQVIVNGIESGNGNPGQKQVFITSEQ